MKKEETLAVALYLESLNYLIDGRDQLGNAYQYQKDHLEFKSNYGEIINLYDEIEQLLSTHIKKMKKKYDIKDEEIKDVLYKL